MTESQRAAAFNVKAGALLEDFLDAVTEAGEESGLHWREVREELNSYHDVLGDWYVDWLHENDMGPALEGYTIEDEQREIEAGE